MSFWDGFYFGLGLTLASVTFSLLILGPLAIISVILKGKNQ